MDDPDTTEVMHCLSDGLWWYRRDTDIAWDTWIPQALEHPVRDLVHQDPFTYRSFSKPRGYAGDAGLLDLIYYDQGFANVASVSQLGRRIFWRNRNAPAPIAVRERRDHIAAVIDQTALAKPNARILSVACGHLREGLKSRAVAAGTLGQLVAFDQDRDSLSVITKSMPDRVVCIAGSVRNLLAGSLEGAFDLIYAAGLYDYLEDRLARRLAARLFAHLRPGGRMILANFTEDIADAGYMETYMGWHLKLRSASDIQAFLDEIPQSEIAESSLYFLGASDIAYVSCMRSE